MKTNNTQNLIVFLIIVLTFFNNPNLVEAKKLKNKDPITVANVLTGLNATRELYKFKIKPVIVSEELSKIAEKRIDDMIKYKYFAHDNPVTKVKSYNVVREIQNIHKFNYTGEILAKDFTKNKDLIQSWIKSKTHYSAIINNKYTSVGIAIKGNMVTVIFTGYYK